MWLSRVPRDVLTFHAVFMAVAIPAALTVQGRWLGLLLCLCALLYNLTLPLFCQWRGDREGLALWRFLLPLSIALPCADWMLVERMQTLQFPDHGAPRLGGAVPIYFMGFWIMLLWPLLRLAQAWRHGYLWTGASGLLAFVIWEWAARPMALWHAVDVTQIAGFALYPLLPEAALCMLALWAWRQLRHQTALARLIAGLAIAVFYAGALSLALLWIG